MSMDQYTAKYSTDLCALRSLSIAGATVLAYDTILLFAQEVRYVWPYALPWRRKRSDASPSSDGPFSLPRLLILCIRYIALANVSVYIMTLLPVHPMSNSWVPIYAQHTRCRRATTVVANIDVLLEVTGSAIIVQCLSKLCSFTRRDSLCLIIGFVIMKTISLAFGLVSVGMEAPTSTSFNSTLKACVISRLSQLTLASWISAAAFDAFCLCLLTINVLSRPRLGTQPILAVLHAHGVIYFLTTFCLRTMNVLFAALSKEAPLFFMGSAFSGTMVTVAATRSFLRFFRPRDAIAAAQAPLAERRVVWQDAGAPSHLRTTMMSAANANAGDSGAGQGTVPGLSVGLARHEVMVCVCCLRPDSGGVLARDVTPDYDHISSGGDIGRNNLMNYGYFPDGYGYGCNTNQYPTTGTGNSTTNAGYEYEWAVPGVAYGMPAGYGYAYGRVLGPEVRHEEIEEVEQIVLDERKPGESR